MKTGFAIHCHHDTLFEYCYDYDERVRAIKETKPIGEQEIRLRLFKILSKEAIAELPIKIIEARKAWDEAYKACNEACKAWHAK